MVEPLKDRPADQNAARWLRTVARANNLNRVTGQETITVAGLPALDVQYQNVAADVEMEEIYVVSGFKTFAISFDGQRAGARLRDLPAYGHYRRMVATFKVSAP